MITPEELFEKIKSGKIYEAVSLVRTLVTSEDSPELLHLLICEVREHYLSAHFEMCILECTEKYGGCGKGEICWNSTLNCLNRRYLVSMKEVAKIICQKYGHPIPENLRYWDEWLVSTLQQLSNKTTSPDVWEKLPKEVVTPRAKIYFTRAIEKGYMEIINNEIRWIGVNLPESGRGANAQLGYFLFKVYEHPRPIKALEKVFEVAKLSASITQASIEPKRADVTNWRAEIDTNIFYD